MCVGCHAGLALAITFGTISIIVILSLAATAIYYRNPEVRWRQRHHHQNSM